MDPVTRAVAEAYAAVLSRRTKRTWLICPGPSANPTAASRQVSGSLVPEKDTDALAGHAAGAGF